jgi:hypothetical protein
MSVPAARIRTSTGWRDIAIQGAPGIPGYTPSAKAKSAAFGMAAADANARIYTPGMTAPDFNDFSVNPFSAGYFLCPAAGRYLVGFALSEVAQGTIQIAMMVNDAVVPRRVTLGTATGADGSKGGVEIWDVLQLGFNATIKLVCFNTGGGATNILTMEVVRLDAPALNIVTNIPLVTSLPASPVDGQEVYYVADATNGVIWHLRYRAAAPGSYKWEMVGGSGLYVWDPASTGNGAIQNAWTDGTDGAKPTITLPLAGDYDLEDVGFYYIYENAVNIQIQVGLKVGAAAIIDLGMHKAPSANWNAFPKLRPLRFTAAKNDICKLQYYGIGGGFDISGRGFRIKPVRVG